jgi:hypothetical protein
MSDWVTTHQNNHQLINKAGGKPEPAKIPWFSRQKHLPLNNVISVAEFSAL